MNSRFHEELCKSVQSAYENNKPLNVPNFSHWWACNYEDIMNEMRDCASEGTRVAFYELPPDWSFYLEDCREFILSQFSEDFHIRVDLRSAGIRNNLSLQIMW